MYKICENSEKVSIESGKFVGVNPEITSQCTRGILGSIGPSHFGKNTKCLHYPKLTCSVTAVQYRSRKCIIKALHHPMALVKCFKQHLPRKDPLALMLLSLGTDFGWCHNETRREKEAKTAMQKTALNYIPLGLPHNH